jgi:NADH:ubiquinone oxidoreductase subunit
VKSGILLIVKEDSSGHFMIGTRLLTWLKGNYIASDEHGNKYYAERFYFATPKDRKQRRWVIYKGIAEASKVPSAWHAWLHFTTDETPEQVPPVHYAWIKPTMPNLTGTTKAYEPPVDRRATYYQAWQPSHDK